MSTYKKIHGKAVKSVSTNLSDSGAEGQIWFNTTDNQFKSVVTVEAFSSAAALITGRFNLTGVGTGTAGLVFGGDVNPGSGEVRQAKSEEYNGSGWASTPDMNTARDLTGGFGIQTAAATAGGRTAPSPSGSNVTEHYDGSSWTNVPGTLNTTRFGAGGFGTQTAGAVCGGTPPTTNATEEYNGSAWTSVNNMNNSVSSLQNATTGTQTAGIRVAGYPNSNTIELYDGTNWTNSPGTLNTARYAGAFQGTQTAGFYAGGELFPPNAATTAAETWDGTTMTTSPATLAIATKYQAGSKGTSSTNGFICGGTTPAATNNATTQEFNKSTNVITAAAWASGGNFPAPASAVRGFGTVHNAAVSIGGETGAGPVVNSCYSYDGSGWTSVPAVPSTTRNAFAYGTQTAGLYSGGNTSPGQSPVTNASAEFDGSSWTGGPTMSVARGFGASSGVQTSALASGGDNGSTLGVSNVESYNGSSWTAETAYPTGAYGATGCGRSETTAIIFGGEVPYPGNNANVGTYDGSSWTLVATPVNTLLPANVQQASSYGTQTDCIAFGGSSQAATAHYNGTVWSTRPSMGTGRSAGGAGISTDALAFCGSPVPNGGNKTEEFIGETTALNVKTLTQS